MTATITIFHNITCDGVGRSPGFFGYVKGHALAPVARYEADPSKTNICEDAFHCFNVGDDPSFGTPDPRAVQYRKADNRSMSVGDVVLTESPNGEQRWSACASFGWTEIDRPDWVVFASKSGTTSLDPRACPVAQVTGGPIGVSS